MYIIILYTQALGTGLGKIMNRKVEEMRPAVSLNFLLRYLTKFKVVAERLSSKVIKNQGDKIEVKDLTED